MILVLGVVYLCGTVCNSRQRSNTSGDPILHGHHVSVTDEEGVVYTGIAYDSANARLEEAEESGQRRTPRSYHYTEELAPTRASIWLGIPYAQPITTTADRFNPPKNLTANLEHTMRIVNPEVSVHSQAFQT